MSDYYTESQVNRIEEDTYNGAIFEAGKEWERQRDEFNSREHELQSRIAELEALVVSLGDALTATYNSLPTHWRDHYHCPYSYTGLMLEIKKLKVKA